MAHLAAGHERSREALIGPRITMVGPPSTRSYARLRVQPPPGGPSCLHQGWRPAPHQRTPCAHPRPVSRKDNALGLGLVRPRRPIPTHIWRLASKKK